MERGGGFRGAEDQTSNCNFSYIEDGVLTKKSSSDCTLMSSYYKIMRCF